ncbi:hypothetical protein FQN53_004072 [Emmonsiellopsis sp. PD_33]|nr:hypothetical protein FQN53_004072 [Emmonsiellopsis sp. PD_33]
MPSNDTPSDPDHPLDQPLSSSYYPYSPASSSSNPSSPQHAQKIPVHNYTYPNHNVHPHPHREGHQSHIVQHLSHVYSADSHRAPLPLSASSMPVPMPMASSSLSKPAMDGRSSHYPAPHEIAVPPAAAFVLAPKREAASMSDGNTMRVKSEDAHAMGSGSSSPRRSRNRNVVYAGEEDVEDLGGDGRGDAGEVGEENAFFILLRLSFLAPPFSLVASIYTFFVLVFLTLAYPLRFCTPSPFFKNPFSSQICSLLLPLLHKHQNLICKPSSSRCCKPRSHKPARHSPTHRHSNSHRHSNRNSRISSPEITTTTSPSPSTSSSTPSTPPTHPSTSTSTSTHSVPLLVLIHLLSPLLITPILFAAWIAAFFWVFAMILGNPDGTERRDDGRVAVLGVRNWWWIWLCRAKRRPGRRREG